jgi:hypothetical protein
VHGGARDVAHERCHVVDVQSRADEELVQRARHLGGVRETPIAIAFERAHHDVTQRVRHVGACHRRACDLHLHDLFHRAQIAVAREQVLQ